MEKPQTKTYTFYSDSVNFYKIEGKAGPDHFVEGYVATSDVDLLGDLITEKGLSDLLTQLKGKDIKVDIDHEAWKNRPTIIPVAKVVDARKDARGVWVKALLNKHTTRFNEVWGSIKDGFLNAFSFAYKAIKPTYKTLDNGAKIRVLDSLYLLNITFTGNPVNPMARMTDVFMKSLSDFNDYSEENVMSGEKPTHEPKTDAAPENAEMKSLTESVSKIQEQFKSLSEKVAAIEKKSAETEENKEADENKKEETGTENKEDASKETGEAEKSTETLAEVKSEIKSLKESLDKVLSAPQFKAMQSTMDAEKKQGEMAGEAEGKSATRPLDLLR